MPERGLFPRSALCINGKNNTPTQNLPTQQWFSRGARGQTHTLNLVNYFGAMGFPCVQPSKYNCSLACFGNTRNGRIILEQEISLNGQIIMKQREYIVIT